MPSDDLLRGTVLHRDWTGALFRRARWIVLIWAAGAVVIEITRATPSTWIDPLLYLSLPAVMLPFLFSVAWPPRADARRDASGFVLRFTPGWRYGVRAFMIPACTAMGLAPVLLGGWQREPVATGFLVCASVAGVLLAIVPPRESFRVTRDAVVRASPWTGRATRVRWNDVTKVELDRFRRLVLRAPAATIKVSPFLEGSGDFAAQALAALPADVVDAGTNVRALLQAVSARLESAGSPVVRTEERGTPRRRRSQLRAVAVSAGLVAVGVLGWAISTSFEPALTVPIPAGWVDLSPGAPARNFEAFPASVREWTKAPHVVALAAERSAGAISGPDQMMSVRVRSGEVIASDETFARALAQDIPGGRVVSHGAEPVRGVRSLQAEVSFAGGSAIAYAVPVAARTAVVVFTCAPAECARVRGIAAATMAATDGIAERTVRTYVGPLVRSGAMLAVFAAMLVGLLAIENAVRARAADEHTGRFESAV